MAGNRKRPINFHFMLSEEEKSMIEESAARAGFENNLGDYARKMLIDGVVINVDLSPIKELSGQLGHIGNNINQIARKANQTNFLTAEEVEEIKRMLGDIWQLQKSTLSKLGFVYR